MDELTQRVLFTILLPLMVVMLSPLVISEIVRRQQVALWRRVAAELGFEITKEHYPVYSTITGHYRERWIKLKASALGIHTHYLAFDIPTTAIHVFVNAQGSTNCTITRLILPFRLRKASILVDPEFDQQIAISAKCQAAVAAVFAKNDMLCKDWLQRAPHTVRLKGNMLLVARIGVIRDQAKVRQMLHLLIDFAEALERELATTSDKWLFETDLE